MPDHAEIVVVGAGMFGSAAAKYLAREGADVLIIGAGEPVDGEPALRHCFGAHHDQARICRRLGWDPVWAALDSRSLQRFRDIEAEANLPFFHDRGSLILMAGSIEHRTATILRHSREQDIDVERLSSAQLRVEFPALGLPDLTGGTVGLLERSHAGYLNPRKLVAAQLALTLAAGGRYLRAAVHGIEQHRRDWLLHIHDGTRAHTVTAEHVLLATGAFTNHSGLLPTNTRLAMRGFSEPNLLFALDDAQLARLTGLPPVVVVDPDDTGDANASLYLLPPVRYPDGRWYLRIGPGMQPLVRPLDTEQQMLDWYSRRQITPRQRRFLTAAMHTMVPGLGPAPTHPACCIIEKTPTRYPYLGHLEQTLAVAVGGNGHGARGSDEIGRLAAMLLLGKPWDSTIPQDTFTPITDHDHTACTQLDALTPPFGLC